MAEAMSYHVLSMGAGVNSTALMHALFDRQMPLDEVVFADTGAEKEETYSYLEKWIIPFLSKSRVLYTRVAATRPYRIGGMVVREPDTLAARCIRGRAIPDRRYRWSTRDYKITPIHKHLRPRAPVVTYLGIAADEAQRVKPARVAWNSHSWPLIDLGMTRADCESLILSKGWPLPVKSGCWFCPFNRIAEWRNLLKTRLDLFQRAIELEKNGSKYPEFALVDGGLTKLRNRFERESEQKTLTKWAHTQEGWKPAPVDEEECSGYCMT